MEVGSGEHIEREVSTDLTEDSNDHNSEHTGHEAETDHNDQEHDLPQDLSKCSPFHKQVLSVLKGSDRLKTQFVGVRNESYWYYSRKQLGAIRQTIVTARQHPHTFKWEASAYMMWPNEDIVDVPTLREITRNHKSKWLAIKKAEQYCKRRDMNPADMTTFDPKLANRLMQTHFKLLVVSERFYKLSNLERIVLVWEELLSGLGCFLEPQSTSLATCPPSMGSKLASVWGNNVCSLDLFRIFHEKFPIKLIIIAKTPSQWKPDLYQPPIEERFGPSAVSVTSTAIQQSKYQYTSPKKVKHRVNLLTTTASTSLDTHDLHGKKDTNASRRRSKLDNKGEESFLPPIHHNSSNARQQQQQPSLADSIGLPAALSAVLSQSDKAAPTRPPKTGGVFGHFFNDVSPSIRTLMLEKVNENKVMIQRAGFAVAEDNGSLGSGSINNGNRRRQNVRRKGHKAQSEYDIGTNSEAEMWEEYQIASLAIEKYAIRMQRIRRLSVLRRAAQLVWKRRYSCLVLQKVCRGWIGRKLARKWKQLLPPATIRIQQAFRKYKSRNIINTWAWSVLRMSRVVSKRIKQFLSLCAKRWYATHVKHVIRIQSVVRMHLARARYYRAIGSLFTSHVIELAAITIQRVVRGRRVRVGLYAQLVEREIVVRVDIPSAIRIQRIFRGYLGRQLTIFQRKYRFAVKVLQTVVRRFVHRVWYRQMRIERLRNEAAVVIQRHYRGRIDRELVRRIRTNRDFVDRYIPAVIQVQTQIRRANCARRYRALRRAHAASIIIQRRYRLYRHRLAVLARWLALQRSHRDDAAVEIQKIIRGHIARLVFKRKTLVRKGHVTQAAKIIMRAWVNYKQAKRLQLLLDKHRIEIYSKKCEHLLGVRADVELDRKEILEDIEFTKAAVIAAKKIIHNNEVFVVEVQLRLPRIKEELAALSAEDIDRGWPEALKQEFESLRHRSTMAKEENRVRKAALLKLETEVQRLLFELEECDIELDQLACLQMETYEALRRSEVGQIERKVNDKHNRLIRVERCRWKVDSTRLHKIHRKYDRQLNKTKDDLALRDINYAQTVSFENRAAVRDQEDLLFERIRKKSRKLPVEKQYSQYAGLFQSTYDEVLDNNLNILRQFTLDDRIAKMKKGKLEKLGNRRRAGLGQFAPLKSILELGAIANPATSTKEATVTVATNASMGTLTGDDEEETTANKKDLLTLAEERHVLTLANMSVKDVAKKSAKAIKLSAR